MKKTDHTTKKEKQETASVDPDQAAEFFIELASRIGALIGTQLVEKTIDDRSTTRER